MTWRHFYFILDHNTLQDIAMGVWKGKPLKLLNASHRSVWHTQVEQNVTPPKTLLAIHVLNIFTLIMGLVLD